MGKLTTYEDAKRVIPGFSRGDRFECSCSICGKDFSASYELLRKGPATGDLICGYCKGTKTFFDRYGVKGNAARKDVQDRMVLATKGKYGVERPFQNGKVQEKVRDTLKGKYGVEYLFCSQEFQDKKDATVFKRYGVQNIGQVPSVKLKILRSVCSRTSARYNIPVTKDFDFGLLFNEERKVYDALISGKYSSVVYQDRTSLGGFEIDWLLDGKKGIECNGAYWHSLEKKDPNYHLKKSFIALKRGVDLFQFFDFEINKKLEILPSYLNKPLERTFRNEGPCIVNIYLDNALSFLRITVKDTFLLTDTYGGSYVVAIDSLDKAYVTPLNGNGSVIACLEYLLDQGYVVVQDRRLSHVADAHIIDTFKPAIKHNCADAGYAILRR